MSAISYSEFRYQFVTGKLAASATQEIVSKLQHDLGFQSYVDVLPITVAALMTPKWLRRNLTIRSDVDYIVLPGYLEPVLSDIKLLFPDHQDKFVCGPKDIRNLQQLFGKKMQRSEAYGDYSIEILAEINHAPRYDLKSLIAAAKELQKAGADVIDIGCDPNSRWTLVGDAIKALRDEGLRLSIDSFDPWEVQQACESGAELVLSVNSSNIDAVMDWGKEVVLIPDRVGTLEGLESNMEILYRNNSLFRVDPILEPLGCGFAASLERYQTARRLWPDVRMLMGIGNITELTDCDSAGINVILLGICEELKISSVLTTQVINWTSSSVIECDLARRLVHYAQFNGIPPKHIEPKLVTLRDPKLNRFSGQVLEQLATTIRDNNYRIFAQEGEIHIVSANLHLQHSDPYELMEKLMQQPQVNNIDPSHAFYLGFEMSKAHTALTLNKQYEQDEALNWGYLTRPEKHHRLNRKARPVDPPPSDNIDSVNKIDSGNIES
jgi:dihydropteroate synthase